MDKAWKVIAAFVGVFIFGSIFGGLLALRLDQKPAPKKAAQAAGQGPMPGILRNFAEKLDLTPEQREKIRPKVERAEEDIRRVRQNGLRDTGIILKRLQEDFADELTPEQRKKLEKMEERQREVLREKPGAFPLLREKLNPKRPGAAKEEPAPAKSEGATPGK